MSETPQEYLARIGATGAQQLAETNLVSTPTLPISRPMRSTPTGEFAAAYGCAPVQKPRYASPCNHCGLCCRLSRCHVGELAFPTHTIGPCPALIQGKDGSLCVLVIIEAESEAERMIAKQLGIGCGCSMEDDDTTPEEAAEFDRRSRAKVFGHNAKLCNSPEAARPPGEEGSKSR